MLPDWEIITCGHIDPFEKGKVNPASYDLTLSNEWIDMEDSKHAVFVSDSITLYPRSISTEFINFLCKFKLLVKLFKLKKRMTMVLASTMEVVSIPDDYAAMVKLKTTPCREGLGHPIADWVDPGFSGKLTLMLHAFKPIKLYSGGCICQIVICKLNSKCLVSYNKVGHYNGQVGPTPSWKSR